jgi:hypothetical protein
MKPGDPCNGGHSVTIAVPRGEHIDAVGEQAKVFLLCVDVHIPDA